MLSTNTVDTPVYPYKRWAPRISKLGLDVPVVKQAHSYKLNGYANRTDKESCQGSGKLWLGVPLTELKAHTPVLLVVTELGNTMSFIYDNSNNPLGHSWILKSYPPPWQN